VETDGAQALDRVDKPVIIKKHSVYRVERAGWSALLYVMVDRVRYRRIDMRSRKTNILRIVEAITPVAKSLDLDLLDVIYVHENGRNILRLVIDKRGGVGIEDCESLSELADPIISDELGLDDFDTFEVSSPGIDRPLKTMDDFIRHEGAYVRLSLYRAIDGEKRLFGHLIVDGDRVGVEAEGGERVLFDLEQIANIKREIVF
jgi:ribosome maturation factor RimP